MATPEHGVRILVVEDEESFVDALKIGLAREGFDVAVATDGMTAIGLFNSQPFDIVLLDLMLPKMSGLCLLYTSDAADE